MPATVLIVDDDKRLCARMTEAFAGAGYEAIVAGDALEAVSLVEERPELALIVADIRIPGRVDGILFTQLAAQRRPRTPILVISGAERPDATDLPPGAGFLRKPFTAETLLAEARRLIGA